MKIKILAILLLTFSIVACGSTETQRSNKPMVSNANRPEWTKIQEDTIDQDNIMMFLGTSDRAESESHALSLAEQNATLRVSNYFGVKVQSLVENEISSVNGTDSYRLSMKSSQEGKQIEVTYKVSNKYTEYNNGEWSGYVLIAVTKQELARIQIEVDGFGVWALKSNIPESEDKILTLFEVFKNKGINILKDQKIAFSNQSIDSIFQKTRKAFFLKIECDEIKSEEYNGEFYSVISFKADLFDLITGKMLKRWSVETKGAAYSKKEAVSIGISKAVEEIADQF